jgi:hypothetical protein
MKLVIEDFNFNDHFAYIDALEKALDRVKRERDAYKIAYEKLTEDEFDMDGRC